MRVKSQEPNDQACRCCKHELENLTHFAVCEVSGHIFSDFANLIVIGGRDDLKSYANYDRNEKARFGLFALTPGNGHQLPEGWVNFHLLLWKHLIYSITMVEIEDKKFAPHEVWQATWTRLEKKVLAKQVGIRAVIRRADSRGETLPDIVNRGKVIAPLASLSPDGKFEWNELILTEIKRLATPPPKRIRQRNASAPGE